MTTFVSRSAAWSILFLLFYGVIGASYTLAEESAGILEPGTTQYPNGGMRRMDAISFKTGDGNPWCALMDPLDGHIYFGTNNQNPGKVVKIKVGTADTLHQYVETKSLNGFNSDYFKGGAIDPDHGFAYFGSSMKTPGHVVRVRLDFNYAPALEEITLQDVGYPRVGLIHKQEGYLYFAADNTSSATGGRVVKIDIHPTRTFKQVQRITLPSGENSVQSGVLDEINNCAYF